MKISQSMLFLLGNVKQGTTFDWQFTQTWCHHDEKSKDVLSMQNCYRYLCAIINCFINVQLPKIWSLRSREIRDWPDISPDYGLIWKWLMHLLFFHSLKLSFPSLSRVILWQLFKIPSCVYMKGKFVTHVSFASVRLINHSWDRIKCLASCFIKNIFFLRLLLPWGCTYLSLPSQYFKRIFSYLFFNINHKTDMNINE